VSVLSKLLASSNDMHCCKILQFGYHYILSNFASKVSATLYFYIIIYYCESKNVYHLTLSCKNSSFTGHKQ